MELLHVFTEEEKEKIMKAKDMITTAKEMIAKKLGKRQVSEDNVIFEVSRFDNVIKTVDDTQKVISWVSDVAGYVEKVTNKQKPVAEYVTKAVKEKKEILESSAADIVLKSYNGAKTDLSRAVEDLRAQRDGYMEKGAHPDIIKLFDAALVYAIATEEAVDSTMNVPLSTISEYIKKAEAKKGSMVERLTKEKMPEPVVVVSSVEEAEDVEGEVIAAEIVPAPKMPTLAEKGTGEPKKKPSSSVAMVSKIMAAPKKEYAPITPLVKNTVPVMVKEKKEERTHRKTGVMYMAKKRERTNKETE